MDSLHQAFISTVVSGEAVAKKVELVEYLQQTSTAGLISVWVVSEVILLGILLFLVSGALGSKLGKSALASLGDAIKGLMGNSVQVIRGVVLTSVNFFGAYYFFHMLAEAKTYPILIAVAFQIMIGFVIISGTSEKVVAAE